MDAGRHSRLNRLLRVTASVNRSMANCRVSGTYRGSLTAEKLANAGLYWVKGSQRDGYAREMLLANQFEVHERSSIALMNPFADSEGRLHVGGRLQYADVTSGVEHPILLPHDHSFTELVV